MRASCCSVCCCSHDCICLLSLLQWNSSNSSCGRHSIYPCICCVGGELQGLLDLWKVWPGQTFTPSSLNAKQVTERVTRELLGEGFIVVDVRDAAGLDYKVHKQPYWMPIRENMMGAVQQLISQCPADAFAKFPAYVHENGEKVYNEFWTGELWNETQVGAAHSASAVWTLCPTA